MESIEPKLRGLETVRVSKDFLLEKLKINKEEHRKVFEEAIEGWHIEVLNTLKDMVKRAKSDKRYNPQWYLPVPTDHTREYDQIIELVQASLDTEFELTAIEFAQYVRDDWGWKRDFIGTISNYVNTKWEDA